MHATRIEIRKFCFRRTVKKGVPSKAVAPKKRNCVLSQTFTHYSLYKYFLAH
jgi:hypothetical protein